MGRLVEVHDLVTIGSIEEYRAVNSPQLRSLGKQPLSPWSYPCRGFVGCGLKETTQIVLPDVSPLREFTAGLKSIWFELGVADISISPEIWVEDPLIGERDALDYAILNDLAGFRSQLDKGISKFLVTPHANTPEMSEWRERLNRDYEIETEVVMAPKPYTYPNIFDRSGFAEFAKKYKLPIPYSRVASGKRELIEAYEDVARVSGKRDVWSKLAASGGGYGIDRVSNVTEVEAFYERLNLLGVLKLYGQEIPWEMQAHVDNIIALYSWSYLGNKITTPGGFSLQYMDPNSPFSWIGNGYNIPIPEIPQETVNSIARDLEDRTTAALKEELGPDHKYMGGFDFAIIRDEQANYGGVLLEHNGARMIDSVMQFEAARSLGVNLRDPFLVIKLGLAYCSITEVWQYLKKTGFSYNPSTKEGAMPFVWFGNNQTGYASVMIAAHDAEQLTKLHNLSVEAMRHEGMIN